MRVGIYCDLRNPAAWRVPWARHYGQALERIEEAERLGLASVWLSEHHLFEDGYLPQPLTFAAAIAARTRRLRIGTAVVLAPLRTAIDIAEQAAIVDLLSDGRLELGLGAGYARPEFEAFGVDRRDRFRLLEERLVEVRRLWEDGCVSPPGVQAELPLWAGVSGPRGARMAGRLGAGLLWLDGGLLDPYREGLREGGHDAGAARMAGLANLVLADDPEAAWARLAPHALHQVETYRAAMVAGTPAAAEAAARPLDSDRLRSPGPAMHPPHFDVVTPDEAIRRLRTWLVDMPVVEIFCWDSIASMPEDLVKRHLELLATVVAPAVTDLGVPTAA